MKHILARSEERVFPGACVELIIKYNGEQNTLHEDKVKMTLLSGKAKLLIIIPTKVWFLFEVLYFLDLSGGGGRGWWVMALSWPFVKSSQ